MKLYFQRQPVCFVNPYFKKDLIFRPLSSNDLTDNWFQFWIFVLVLQLPGFQQCLVTYSSAGFPRSHCLAGAWLPSTYYVQDNFILINADVFLLALKPYLQSIWYKLLKPSCCTKPALSNMVLAHVSTGAPKLPLCLQEPLKLLIAFCANGP